MTLVLIAAAASLAVFGYDLFATRNPITGDPR